MTKISELTSIVTAAATDIIAVVQGGVTKRATVQDYRDAGIIPTADQAAALAAYEAALAAAEADQVLTASGPGEAAFAAPAGGGASLGYTEAIISIEQTGSNNPVLGVLKNDTGLTFNALRFPNSPPQYLIGIIGGTIVATRTEVSCNIVSDEAGTYAKTLLTGLVQPSSIILMPYNVKSATYGDLALSVGGRLPIVTIRIYD